MGDRKNELQCAGKVWEGRDVAEGCGPIITPVAPLALGHVLGQDKDVPWHLAANLVPSQVLVGECICVIFFF